MTALTTLPQSGLGAANGYLRFIRTPAFIALLLGIALATPSAVSYIFLTSSQAAGTAVMAITTAFILAPVVRFRPRLFVIIALLTVITGHFLVARNMIPANNARFASSLALLLGMVFSAHFVAHWLIELPETALRRALSALRIAMIVIAILSIVHIEPHSWNAGVPEKAIFPFTEHSHFALVFTPLLLDGTVRARGLRRPAWLLVGLIVGALLQNLTVLVGVALVAVITAPFWQLGTLLVIAAGAAMSMDLTYYLARLDLSTGTTNLSSLVYIQGYEFIVDSFQLTSGWGMGFQQLGVIPMNSLASNVIYALTRGSSLNVYDGGFGASKIISELGILGIAVTLFFAVVSIRLAWRLRAMALMPIIYRPDLIFPYSFIVGFVIEMFVRGVGYFSATVFMLMVSFLLLRLQADHRKVAQRARARNDRPLKTMLQS